MDTKTDTSSLLALAAAREDAANDLEVAVHDLGIAYRRYSALTQQLSELVGPHLGRRLEVPIYLHLAKAGLGPLLQRQLTGEPASLRSICETDHQRLVTR